MTWYYHPSVNLVKNGGFEEDPHLLGWVANEGVDVFAAPEENTHQGLWAARLGFAQSYALLYQDVPVVPGCHYQLNFYLTAGTALSNAPVWIRLRYLSRRKCDLDSAIDVMIEQLTLSQNTYTGFLNFTSFEAPRGTCYARIEFEIDTSDSGGHVDLDDVSLVAI